VSNGTVFVTASGALEAFDAAGNSNCSGSPKVCSPTWTSEISAPTFSQNAVAVLGGIAYALSSVGGTASAVVALDANGSTGCGGTPKVCTPLREYPLTEPVNSQNRPTEYVSVSGTSLYVGTSALSPPAGFVGSVEALDANGVKGCSGTPVVCSPLWTSPNTFPSVGPPVVASGYAISQPFVGPFAAFDANGKTNCSGNPVVCNPVWTSSIGNGTGGQVIPFAIGGSVIYVGDSPNLYAFDASGSAGCAASVCSPLWSTNRPNGSVNFSNVIVANGMVYASTNDSSGNGEVFAYGLP
jgi:hypothetical protein